MSMPIDYLNFISYASYRTSYIDIYLENGQFLTKNQNSLGIGHKKLGNSTEKGMERIKK